ncbi:MAG: hypothetical protein ABEJ30_09965 [Halorientalis sp.]
MPCPHASVEAPSPLSRRDFAKSALAIGGSSALAACADRGGMPDVPRGVDDPDSLPERQFAWDQFLPRDQHGNIALPEHQLLLFFDYASGGVPTGGEREQVETALRGLERAYLPGSGRGPHRPAGRMPPPTPGLLFTLGYAPGYFDRYEPDLPVPLPTTEETLNAIGEPADRADSHDVAMVLVSDYVEVLLTVEQALLGNLDSLNGVEMPASFDGVLERTERRTGFVEQGRPAEEFEAEEIPESSPAAMGFKSGLENGKASEDRVTIREGPFAEGTTQHVSRLVLSLDSWYDNSDEERLHQMFSPHHSADAVGPVARRLASHNGITPEIAARAEEDAAEYDRVGHVQKAARGRDEDFEPTILRRSEAASTDLAKPAFNFTSVQRRIDRFVDVRRAMNESYDVPAENHGIRNYIEATERGNYLVPPRSLRALPPARPDR